MNYRELVASHLQSLKDKGLTNQQIADKLGLEKGNYISMLRKPAEKGTVLALNRLPALAAACGLDDRQSLLLIFKLAQYGCASEWDAATFRWHGTVLTGALRSYKARKAATLVVA